MATEQKRQYIFLVDDEPIQNEMLKDYISENFNFEIKTFDNGEDAIKNLHLEPEVIVLDFHLNAHLPNAQNGIDILKRIKEKNPDCFVVMLSGQDKLEVAVESMKYGAHDYVIKGETAFSRIKNIINKIAEMQGVKDSNKAYKNATMFLSVILVVILIGSFFMVKKLNTGSWF